jgi:hypothetical protein
MPHEFVTIFDLSFDCIAFVRYAIEFVSFRTTVVSAFATAGFVSESSAFEAAFFPAIKTTGAEAVEPAISCSDLATDMSTKPVS